MARHARKFRHPGDRMEPGLPGDQGVVVVGRGVVQVLQGGVTVAQHVATMA